MALPMGMGQQIDPRRLQMAQALAGGQLPMSVMPPSTQRGGQMGMAPGVQVAQAPVQHGVEGGGGLNFPGQAVGATGYNYMLQQGADPEEMARAAAGLTAPAEIAARVGLAQVFLGQYPAIREIAARGDLTGPVDHAAARLGFGERGEAWRQIESGVDSLRRMLTGAGMTANETNNYISRYQPSIQNRSEDLVSKLDQLALEVKSVSEIVASGRGLEGLMQRVRQGAGEGYQPPPNARQDASQASPQPSQRQPRGGGEWMDLGGGVRMRAVGQ